MLVLTRKVGESIIIPSQGLTIQVGSVKRGRVRLRITAPQETRILREEVAEREAELLAVSREEAVVERS